jgi:hypothetical protein
MFAQGAAIYPAILTSMPDRDEKLLRAALDAWNRGDWDAVVEHCDPDKSTTAGLDVDQPVAFHFEIHDHLLTRFVSLLGAPPGVRGARPTRPRLQRTYLTARRYPCTPGARSSAG